MRMFVLCLSALVLMSCASDDAPPVNVAVNTLCTSTTAAPPTTPKMRATYKADPDTWEPLVTWLLGFQRVRDKNCLTSSGFGD